MSSINLQVTLSRDELAAVDEQAAQQGISREKAFHRLFHFVARPASVVKVSEKVAKKG